MALAIFLAFVMTLVTASSNVVLKKAFSKSEPFLAVYISVAISVFFLWIATFLFVPKPVFCNYKAIVIFVLIGSFAPTIVRTLTYYGIHTLGAGRAAPLRATTPFFATVMAILFLKESAGPAIFFGITLIVLGVTALVRSDEQGLSSWKPVHLFYPLGAAFLAGCAANLRKYGLTLMPQPIFASAIAATSSLVILTPYMIFKKKKDTSFGLLHIKELKFIVIASLLTSAGEIIDLSALLLGKVSLVVPIFATTPLMVVFFSHVFLKREEVITRKIVLATILIILGVSLAIASA